MPDAGKTNSKWRYLLVALVLVLTGVVAWQSYTGSPDFAAGQTLGQADHLIAAGNLSEAARLLSEVAQGGTSRAPTARDKLNELLTETLPDATPHQRLVATDIRRWENRPESVVIHPPLPLAPGDPIGN